MRGWTGDPEAAPGPRSWGRDGSTHSGQLRLDVREHDAPTLCVGTVGNDCKSMTLKDWIILLTVPALPVVELYTHTLCPRPCSSSHWERSVPPSNFLIDLELAVCLLRLMDCRRRDFGQFGDTP